MAPIFLGGGGILGSIPLLCGEALDETLPCAVLGISMSAFVNGVGSLAGYTAGYFTK